MKALVTGAYGFVGRHVAKSLATSGYVVRAIGHGPWSRDEWREWGISDWRLTDVNMEALVTYGGEPDVIFHCAGSGSVAFSMTHPHQDYQRTVTTTHAVLEYIRTVQPQARLIVPSSAGVYGVAQSLPISVNDMLRPASPYGVHKKITEDLCRAYGKHFGVRTAIVRLFSIYGRGLRKQLLWDACGKLRAGDATFGGTGQETRDWLHVTDAAALMLAGADHASTECPIVNGGTGEATAVSTIVELIADCLGGHGRPLFSGLSRPGDPTDYQADITEAKAWGWTPTQTWRDGIRDYVQWFEEEAQ